MGNDYWLYSNLIIQRYNTFILKNPIKISVIIPSYNRFEYLLNAIDSVKNQTYSNIEIIVINDGSTQKEYYENNLSSEIIKIDLQTNQKNIIGYVSEGYIRNFGINKASGEYLAFLDDDDIWMPEKLEMQLNRLLETGSKFSSTEGFYGKGIFDNSKNYPLYNEDYFFEKISKKSKFMFVWILFLLAAILPSFLSLFSPCRLITFLGSIKTHYFKIYSFCS